MRNFNLPFFQIPEAESPKAKRADGSDSADEDSTPRPPKRQVSFILDGFVAARRRHIPGHSKAVNKWHRRKER